MESVSNTPKVSLTMKHKIVRLDALIPSPPLPESGYEWIGEYSKTSPEQLIDRIKEATIVINSTTRVPRAAIEAAPNLQLWAATGVGTDNLDKEAIRDRGITLCNVPAQNTDSVSEHAFALYYAIRRRVLRMHDIAMDGTSWPSNNMIQLQMGEPPRTNAEETLVIVGYGALGRKIEQIARALGMTVLLAERKGAENIRQGRTAFDTALKEGTVFMLVTPLDATTRDMISAAELQMMDPTALVVNVGRGGVINETALANALRNGVIAGAATDVFASEPASKATSPLLDPSIPNLLLSPHVAWYSSRTINGTLEILRSNIEGFVAGKPQNVVIAGNHN